MLPCSLPYIRNIRKTIHTTIWPNHNNNNNNNDESNYNVSFPKHPTGESEESAACKVIIEKKRSDQTCETSQEVKVRPAEVVLGTPHPLRRRIRPDSPHVELDGRDWSRRETVTRLCERISEREEEMSDCENNQPEGGDGDFEESDSVFEEESESENEAEKTR